MSDHTIPDYAWDHPMYCPKCGEINIHIRRVYALEGQDKGEPEGRAVGGELYGIPVGGVSDARRGALAIEFYCEHGCAFVLYMQQHKGTTYTYYRLIPCEVTP